MGLVDLRVLSLVHHEYEDLELWYPVLRLKEEGVSVVLAGEKQGETYFGKYGLEAVADESFHNLNAADFDALLIPGGWAPDKLRRFDSVLQIVQQMNEQQKIIGQICHAGWVLISAKIASGRTLTSTPGIKDDLMNAGAVWLNEPVVVDGNIISAQRPPDLPEYMRQYISALTEWHQQTT